MLRTLFYIPEQIHFPEPIGDVKLFGFGLLLAVWAVAGAVFLVRQVRRHGLGADTLGYLPVLLVVGAAILWVLPHISEPGRGLAIRGYGAMVLAGVGAGTALSMWRGRAIGMDAERVATLIFWGFVPGILGARLFFVVEYWSDFRHGEKGDLLSVGQTLLAILDVTKGGLVVYGALVGGLIGFAVYLLKEKLPMLPALDVVAPGMLLGLALGRVGCFLNGCCFGGACELPWAVTFPVGSPPYDRQVDRGEVFPHGLVLAPLSRERSHDAPTIVAVEPGSLAQREGVKPGQRIAAIDGQAVTTLRAATEKIHKVTTGQPVCVTIEGGPEVCGHARSHPVHPTQLYSAIDATVLCLLLLAWTPFQRRYGEAIALLLTLYPINRFLMEFIRTDEPGLLGTRLTIGQFVSLAMLLLAAGLWAYVLRTPRIAGESKRGRS